MSAGRTGFFGGLQNVRGLGVRVDGFALHYYTDFRQTAEDGARFDAKGWYAVLHKGVRIETVITDHWAIMGKYDPQHRTKFVIDEWGNWYRGGTELGPEYILSQTITLRDALHTAMTFDIFNRHADKIEMANVAQTINCLHSLFLPRRETSTPARPPTTPSRCTGPTWARRLVPVTINLPEMTVPVLEGTAKLPRLSGSASVRDKSLTVTLTNPSLEDRGGHTHSSGWRREPARRPCHGADPPGHARDQHVRSAGRGRPGSFGGAGIGEHRVRHHSEAGGRRPSRFSSCRHRSPFTQSKVTADRERLP